MFKIAPSMLSCDFSQFGQEIIRMDKAGADLIHLDVMDGHFVPNISFGASVIKSIKAYSDKTFDVHLMLQNPLDFIEDFAKAGADILTFNLEADSPVYETIAAIRSYGIRPALSIKPATCVRELYPYIGEVDMFLIMTVEPGFGGQSFMPQTLDKVRALRDKLLDGGFKADIEVDGGINLETIGSAAAAGANIFVSGSTIFAAQDAKAMIEKLRRAAQNARNSVVGGN